MQSIYLDAARYETDKDVHLALKEILSLPEYYGCNADALYDCLSERRTPINLFVFHADRVRSEAVKTALNRCMRVVVDLGGEASNI